MNRAVYFVLIVVVALAAGLAGHRFSNMAGDQPAQVPGQSPASLLGLSLPDTQGKPQPLAQWRGKILVVNFWATWCPPCRREIPGFMRLSSAYASRGVQFVGIGVDDASDVRRYAEDKAIPYPILVGDMDVFRVTTTLGNPTEGLPFTLVLDRQGRIAYTKEGMLPEAELERILDTLATQG